MTRRAPLRLPLAALLVAAAAGLMAAGAPEPEPSQETSFSAYTPLASNRTLAERMLPPLTGAKVDERLAAFGKGLRDQPVDLTRERFRVLVPRTAPPGGYGLLVFVPPWDGALVLAGWEPVLEQQGVIFVTPLNAGNAASALGRREPLAVLAAFNVMRLHPVNPERVYVAGFSGGSRVALRLALGYPDVFRGAFLDAGADPIGDGDVPPPPRALYGQFLATSRLAFFTGAEDAAPMQEAAGSMASLRRRCFSRLSARTQVALGHEPAPPTALQWALSELDKPRSSNSGQEACVRRMDAEVAAALDRVQSALARGDAASAARLLAEADRRFGGLAAPRSVELARQLASRGG